MAILGLASPPAYSPHAQIATRADSSKPPVVVLDEDRTEIYQRAVLEIAQQHGGRINVVGVSLEIKPDDPMNFLSVELPTLIPRLRPHVDPETIASWIADSGTPHNLSRVFQNMGYGSIVPPDSCDDACFNGEATPKVSVTGIGLNATRTKALIWAQYYCGSLCGNSIYIILAKREGAWRTETMYAYAEY